MLNHLQWTVFYWLKHKYLKPPGWSLLCKTGNSTHFMTLYPDRILCSLYFVLCVSSPKDWTVLLCAWHVKKRTWKQCSVQLPVWTAQKPWERTKALLPGCKCEAVNLCLVHRNQSSDSVPAMKGQECMEAEMKLWSMARMIPQDRQGETFPKVQQPSSWWAKNWVLPLQLRVTESEQRAQLFTPHAVSQSGCSHPWVEKWHSRIVPFW